MTTTPAVVNSKLHTYNRSPSSRRGDARGNRLRGGRIADDRKETSDVSGRDASMNIDYLRLRNTETWYGFVSMAVAALAIHVNRPFKRKCAGKLYILIFYSHRNTLEQTLIPCGRLIGHGRLQKLQ